MTNIEKCEVVCWVCDRKYSTIRILSCSSSLPVPTIPRCPDCGAYPRAGTGGSLEWGRSLLSLFLQGDSAQKIAGEIEGRVTDEKQLAEWLESFGKARDMRISELRDQFRGQAPTAIRPQTQTFYDDKRFAEKMCEIRKLALSQMHQRRREFLNSTN